MCSFFLYWFFCVWWNQMAMCFSLTYYTKIYNTVTIYVNKLILPPFSPFDIKCKKLNMKNIWKCLHSIMRWGCPRYLLEFLLIMLQYSIQALCNISDGALSDKKDWTLLLTVVTESFVLNVTGVLDLTLKCINEFRLRQ